MYTSIASTTMTHSLICNHDRNSTEIPSLKRYQIGPIPSDTNSDTKLIWYLFVSRPKFLISSLLISRFRDKNPIRNAFRIAFRIAPIRNRADLVSIPFRDKRLCFISYRFLSLLISTLLISNLEIRTIRNATSYRSYRNDKR